MPYFTQKSKIKVAKSIVLSFIFFARVPSLRIKFHQLTNKQSCLFHQLTNKQSCLLLLETLNEKRDQNFQDIFGGQSFMQRIS